MSKFLRRVSIFLLYGFLLQVVLPVAVDPFNVFHADNIRDTGISTNSNYVKVKYVLDNPDKFDGFIFGSSRIGAVHAEKIPGRIYNMMYPGGMPSEHLLNLKTFVENDVKLFKIYLGVDSLSYTGDIIEHIIQPSRCPYEYLYDDPKYFFSLYMNPMDTLRSIFIMFTSPEKPIDRARFYSTGNGIVYNQETKYIWKNDKDIRITMGRGMHIAESLRDIQKIYEICREHKIELTIFTNPMHRLTYMASLDKRYFEFLEGLAKITDFWNFSSLNNVTLDNNSYIDDSHYKAETGDIMLNVMCSGEVYPELQAQGFGVKVTRENAKDFISMLRRQAEDFKHKNSPAP